MLERRIANVHRQLQLWPADQESTQWIEIWESLDHQQQTTVIIALARLIVKVIYPNDLNETREKKYE
jgi:hypothetical protein